MPEHPLDAAGDANLSGADTFYFAHLAAGEFVIPRCNECARFHFYPRLVCPHCGSVDLTWQPASGTGTVYSTTVVRRPDGDYNLALIDLAEGPTS